MKKISFIGFACFSLSLYHWDQHRGQKVALSVFHGYVSLRLNYKVVLMLIYHSWKGGGLWCWICLLRFLALSKSVIEKKANQLFRHRMLENWTHSPICSYACSRSFWFHYTRHQFVSELNKLFRYMEDWGLRLWINLYRIIHLKYQHREILYKFGQGWFRFWLTTQQFTGEVPLNRPAWWNWTILSVKDPKNENTPDL